MYFDNKQVELDLQDERMGKTFFWRGRVFKETKKCLQFIIIFHFFKGQVSF